MHKILGVFTGVFFMAASINPENVGSTEGTASPDFVEMAAKAFPADGEMDREAGDRLWSQLYKLPEWYFLMTPKSMTRKQPSAQVIDGKGWYLVFTDTEKLQAYAKQNQNVDKKGNAYYMTMTPAMAIEFARKNADGPVFGVRFNEGQKHGWFAPMRNLTIFPNYLKKKGLL